MEETYTYEMFQEAWDRREREDRIRDAWDGKNTYAKMANQTRMTKKRLKKLLMAEGLSRNRAEETVERVSKRIKNGRLVWWNRQLPYVAQRIEYRQSPLERVMDSVGCYITKEDRELFRKARKRRNTKKCRAAFEDFNRLREKFPDCTTKDETLNAWKAKLVKDGFSDDIREMWALTSWFYYLEACND